MTTDCSWISQTTVSRYRGRVTLSLCYSGPEGNLLFADILSVFYPCLPSAVICCGEIGPVSAGSKRSSVVTAAHHFRQTSSSYLQVTFTINITKFYAYIMHYNVNR